MPIMDNGFLLPRDSSLTGCFQGNLSQNLYPFWENAPLPGTTRVSINIRLGNPPGAFKSQELTEP